MSDGTVLEPAGPKEKKKDPEKERARREKYERHRDVHGVFKPGPCAKLEAAKMQERTKCEHPFEDLKWGGSDTSMYASFTRCGWKTRVMYNKIEAFVTDAETELNNVHLVELAPGRVMIGTSCRAAVGGRKWHQGLQGRLTALAKELHCEEQ